MSHPIPGHEYGENEYESDSPHKDVTAPKHKALKRAKLNKTQKMTASWLHEAGKSLPKKGEAPLKHLKRLTKKKETISDFFKSQHPRGSSWDNMPPGFSKHDERKHGLS